MSAAAPKDFAIIVGIDQYENLDPLYGARNDATDFLSWLKSDIAGNLPDSNVDPFILLSKDDASSPRLHEFRDAVKKLLGLSPNGEERIGRRLYIFLAGHGGSNEIDDAGLLTTDYGTDNLTYISGRLYANLFRIRALFQEVILLMDCCRDYNRELPAPDFPYHKKSDTGAAYKVKKSYAFATGFGRKSREKDFNGRVHGIFSRALIEGLKGEAIDGKGRITGASLKRYIEKSLASANTQSFDQPPDFSSFDLDFVFADGLPPKLVPVTIEFADPSQPFQVLDGDGLIPIPVQVVEVDSNRRRIDLPAGKTYLFRVFDGEGRIVREAGRAVVEEPLNVAL